LLTLIVGFVGESLLSPPPPPPQATRIVAAESNTTGASALALAFVGLLNGLIAAAPDLAERTQKDGDIAISIQNYLLANLHRMDFNVGDLCRQFHCSRATLYRMFREHGGVRTYVRDLRLEHCLRELARVPEKSRGRIRNVAEQWGFYDPSHFCRLFKQRFGISPSEVPRSPHSSESMTARQPSTGKDVPLFSGHSWLLSAESPDTQHID
jgi:AraC-like DNA-binding protein